MIILPPPPVPKMIHKNYRYSENFLFLPIFPLPLIFAFFLNKSSYFFPNQSITGKMKNIRPCISMETLKNELIGQVRYKIDNGYFRTVYLPGPLA